MANLATAILARITEIERRIAGTEVRGKVTHVDAGKALARIEIGKDEDGNSVLSPWMPYAQKAGSLKVHSAPSVGEVMAVRAESGDIQQGVLHPFHWSETNQAPSQDGEIHKLTFGDVTITLSNGGVELVAGGVTFSWTGTGFEQSGGEISHDGTNIGKDHIHGGVLPGGGLSGVPAN